MTDTAITALAGMVPATIIAAATFYTSLRNGKKAEVIRAQTNGHLTKLTEELKAANATIAGMHKTIDERIPKPER